MKRFALTAIPLILLIGLLAIWDFLPKFVAVQYNNNPRIQFWTARHVKDEVFTGFDIDLNPIRTSISDQKKFTLYWHGKPYALSSLTSATLISIGFSHLQDSLYVKQEGPHKLEYRVFKNVPYTLLGTCGSDNSHPCPFAISMEGKPKLSFPARRQDIEKSFGNSYDASSMGAHPVSTWLTQLIYRLTHP